MDKKEKKDWEVKQEASTLGGIKGFSAPFTKMVKRGRGRPNKPNPSKPFKEKKSVDPGIVEYVMGEVVRQLGNEWVYIDDESGVKKGVFKRRSDAWKQQRRERQAASTRDKIKKQKNAEIDEAVPNPKKKKKPKTAQGFQLAPEPEVAPKPHIAPKSQIVKQPQTFKPQTVGRSGKRKRKKEALARVAEIVKECIIKILENRSNMKDGSQ